MESQISTNSSLVNTENSAAAGNPVVSDAASAAPPASIMSVASAPPAKKSSPYLKGIIILLILGVLVGLPLAYYLFFKPENQAPVAGQQKEMPLNGSILTSPTAVPLKLLTLALTGPVDGELTTGADITVSGTTLPGTTVVIFTESNEASVESDTSGNFSAQISLTEGFNTLTVTAFGENGEEKSLSVDVVRDI